MTHTIVMWITSIRAVRIWYSISASVVALVTLTHEVSDMYLLVPVVQCLPDWATYDIETGDVDTDVVYYSRDYSRSECVLPMSEIDHEFTYNHHHYITIPHTSYTETDVETVTCYAFNTDTETVDYAVSHNMGECICRIDHCDITSIPYYDADIWTNYHWYNIDNMIRPGEYIQYTDDEARLTVIDDDAAEWYGSIYTEGFIAVILRESDNEVTGFIYQES